MISPGFRVGELIPVGLTNRPELASQRALVQASLERVRQERFRPFVPSVVMGGAGPGGFFNGGVFGGGPDDGTHLYGGRFDMELGAVWTLTNWARKPHPGPPTDCADSIKPRSTSPTSRTRWPRKWSKHMPNSRRRQNRLTTR